MSNDLSRLIEQDKTIIASKKRAKEIFKQHKNTQHHKQLSICQNESAKEIGYQDWFDLYNAIKQKLKSINHYPLGTSVKEPILNKVGNLLDQILLDGLTNHYSNIIIEHRENNTKVKVRINGELTEYYNPLFSQQEYKELTEYTFNKLTNFSAIKFDMNECQSFAVEYSCINGEKIKIRGR